MAKYTLKTYGWEMEAVAHSLTDEKVEQIQNLVEENEYDSLTECRWDLEESGIIEDIYNPDLFHMSAGMDNGTMMFVVEDEEGNEVLKFDIKETADIYEHFGDDIDPDKEFKYIGYNAIPEYLDGVENVLIIIDENKGGLHEYVFESDEVPQPNDFTCMSGSVDTPDGDWDFISRVFFKRQLLEIEDHLDNSGKASTIEIYRKDGSMIN